jgi:hypothetical protein
MEKDIFADQPYGKAALKKLAPVGPDFRLFKAEWLGGKPEEWTVMRLMGADFRTAKTGPNKGKCSIMIRGTVRTVFITRDEMAKEEA